MKEKDTSLNSSIWPSSLRFVGRILVRYPSKSILMVSGMFFASLAESFGIFSLLPVLEMVVPSSGQEANPIAQKITEILASLGIEATLAGLLLFLVAALIAKALFVWLAMTQVGYVVADVVTDLRVALIDSIENARWKFFVEQPSGRFSHAMSTEASKVSGAYQESSVLISGLFSLIVYLVVALTISWQVVAGGILLGGGVVFLMRGLLTLSRKAGKEANEAMKAIMIDMTDTLGGVKPIKAMGREATTWGLVRAKILSLRNALRQQVVAKWTMKVAQEPVAVAILACGLYVLLTYGDQHFSSVLLLAYIFYKSLTKIGELQQCYQRIVIGEAAYWSFYETLEEARKYKEDISRTGIRDIKLEREITLSDISLSYGDTRILSNINMAFPSGKLISIIGPSGAGKTTILDLVAGLYTQDEGEILIDDIPLSEVDIGAWRENIGYVPQEMFLFHDSVRENVVLGDGEIGDAEVESALRAAGAWGFVSRLPDGFSTIVGEHGARFSGGQRQRIAIARALVRKPKLLILDEVTSGLDADSEAEVCRSLEALRGTVTMISVSHKSTLADASDIVYRVENGEYIRPLVHETPAGGSESVPTGSS